MTKRYVLTLLALFLSYSLVACNGHDGQKTQRTEAETRAEITGLWRLREVDNGVIYRADFKSDKRLTQIFEDHSGYVKERYGQWDLEGDSLYISERQGEYWLKIVELSDTMMLLLRSDSSAMVFDRLPPDTH